ncbi:TIGR00297 family protein [Gloeobacter kilaueensis]|uniref:TIGR00297 family protein n=1 Tax=Gloeobacter kilaueensis (strain ATCC BAA-2537 / CCAP 1431/1 / ULC 316 / JS1) TaxID=1183438 RepID=U5QLG3_GLOK1|nr:TIGR00297 family protein [Gloeobacter kilaueensis]AGY58515.1 hypothetical protein GKIL_2269 [Gloeobacter kilaueensis JS1]
MQSVTNWLAALVVNTVLLLPAIPAKLLTNWGLLNAWILGVIVWGGLGWRGYSIVLVYFAAGTLITRVGFARKAARGIAEKRGGQRGPENVWGSAAVAAFCTLGYLVHPQPLWQLAYTASLATKLSDTTATEVGKAYGRTTFLITTLRPVPAGTEGAVSVEGTLAGIGGSLVIALCGLLVGFVDSWGFLWCLVAAFVATTCESLIGATIQQRGWLTNEMTNVLNTAIGALVAAALAIWTR